MEVKINKEIREFSEAVFFGMSLRQCIFAVLACAVAVALYFLLSPYMGVETLSWMCILGAAPFAALGFIKWHGMTAEQFIWAWIKSELLTPKRLIARTTNLYFDAATNPIKQPRKKKKKTKEEVQGQTPPKAPTQPAQPVQTPVELPVQATSQWPSTPSVESKAERLAPVLRQTEKRERPIGKHARHARHAIYVPEVSKEVTANYDENSR